MPKVGKRHFQYTKRGLTAAKAYAKKTGKRVVYKRPKKKKKSFVQAFKEAYGGK